MMDFPIRLYSLNEIENILIRNEFESMKSMLEIEREKPFQYLNAVLMELHSLTRCTCNGIKKLVQNDEFFFSFSVRSTP